MAGTRDIRSFFGNAQPPVKKRRTMEDAPKINDAKAEADERQEGDAHPSQPVVASFTALQEPSQLRLLMHASWFDLLQKELSRSSFQTLARFLEGEESRKKTIYPRPADVFAALRDCAFSDLKVVILGQDPYHGPDQAHGLSFSVRDGVKPPPSLKNIYKEAMSDVAIVQPTHGCLSSWSRQGVLLLNTVLTVRRGEPNSHKKRGWEQFTDAVISKINKNASNVVFLLWGKPAQDKGVLIDATKHLVVRSSHPSPLGATKTKTPFIGSKCFSRANNYLEEHGKQPIDWVVQ